MIITIGTEHFRVRYADLGVLRPEDKGLLRCDKVARNAAGDWFPCDDDDYLVDAESRQVVAKEVGWDLRRINIKKS